MLQKLKTWLSTRVADDSDTRPHFGSLDANETLSVILMMEIALADGKFEQSEHDYLIHELKRDFDQAPEAAEEVINYAKIHVRDAASLQESTAPLKALAYADKVVLLESLWEVAYADGELDPLEESMLRKLADLLYIDHSDYIRCKLAAEESVG